MHPRKVSVGKKGKIYNDLGKNLSTFFIISSLTFLNSDSICSDVPPAFAGSLTLLWIRAAFPGKKGQLTCASSHRDDIIKILLEIFVHRLGFLM